MANTLKKFQTPDPPENLADVSGSPQFGGEIELSWDVATTSGRYPVAGYNVYRNGLLVYSDVNTFFTDSGLVGFTIYKYVVTSYDTRGRESNRSMPVVEASTGLSIFTAVLEPINFTSTNTVYLDVPYAVDWGDGNPINYSAGNAAAVASGDVVVTSNNNAGHFKLLSNTIRDCDILSGSTLTSMQGFANGISQLKTFAIDDFSNVTTMEDAFHSAGITSFPLVDTSSVLNMRSAFQLASITSFPLINTVACTNFRETFIGCTGLTSFPLINTGNGTDFFSTWANCTNLTAVPSFNFSKATRVYLTFGRCYNLLATPAFNIGGACTDFTEMFVDCGKLVSCGDFGGTGAGQGFNAMFNGCSDLVCLKQISTFSRVDGQSMFFGCTNLVAPDSAEQALIEAGGYTYNNPGSCP